MEHWDGSGGSDAGASLPGNFPQDVQERLGITLSWVTGIRSISQLLNLREGGIKNWRGSMDGFGGGIKKLTRIYGLVLANFPQDVQERLGITLSEVTGIRSVSQLLNLREGTINDPAGRGK
jgi:uncharacterized protein YunC (DUF1805 family)